MAKDSPKKVKKPLAAEGPASLLAAVNPVEKPAQDPHPDGLTEAVVAETQAGKLPAEATPAKEPPHLLTPLAAVWPKATVPVSPKPPEKAAVAEKAQTPTAAQTVKVTFVLLDLGAKQVSLCGDFNGWSPEATPMKRDDAGHWETTIELAPGRYEYKFVVDGEGVPDPLAHENVWNQHGTLNSVIEVGA